ncbi:MAG: HAD family hydrolase [Thermoprotei archaeon]
MLYNNYYSLSLNGDTVYINKYKINKLKSIENIIFDCDGVLIDIRNSYDLSIKETLRYLFKSITNEEIISSKEIYELRLTGLFNNDWDLVHIIALGIFSYLPKSIAETVIKDLKGENVQYLNGSAYINSFRVNFSKFVNFINENSFDRIKEYAIKLCRHNNTLDELNELIGLLGDPMNTANSMIVKLFDSIYYGENLYRQIYNSTPPLNRNGLIENEILLVSEDDLKILQPLIKGRRFLLLTGRSRVGTEYILASLSKYFDFDSSIFIEDLIRTNKDLAVIMKKPSPEPLIKMSGELTTLYVGDSTEDILIAKHARQKGSKIFFAGVTGAKEDIKAYEELFMRSDSDLIVKSVKALAQTLFLIKNSGGFYEGRVK